MNFSELMINLVSNTNIIIRAAAHKSSLTYSQAIQILNIPFDGISMSSLAFKIGLDNSTLTRNIKKLITLKLIERKKNSYDSRAVLVFLTKKGLNTLNSLENNLQDVFYQISNDIDLDIQAHLVNVLENIIWSVDCYRDKKLNEK